MVYKIKTMLKCLFIFVDQNETKRNVIMLFRLVLSRYYYYFAAFLFRGCQGCQVFATKFAQLLLKTSPKLAKSHLEGCSPVKFAFQGLNITLLGSLQPTDMKNNRGNSVKVVQFRGKTADMATRRRRRRHFLKPYSRHYLEDDNKQS